MIIKEVQYAEIKKAIRIAFEDDGKILDFFDPSIEVKNTNEVIEIVFGKGVDYLDKGLKAYEVYEKEKLIGYFYAINKMLVSFGLNIQYRQRKHLKEFFRVIRKSMGKDFICTLYSRNVRAIKWLYKMGMSVQEHNVNYKNNYLTVLKY